MSDQENWGELEDLEELDDFEELVELDELEEENTVLSVDKLTDPEKFLQQALPSYWRNDNLPFQPLVILDNSLNLQWFNQALVELYGLSELKNIRHLAQLISIAEGDERYQEMLLAIRKREMNFSWNHSYDVNIPTKGLCHILLILMPLMEDGDKKPENYLAIIEDHTERQRKLVFNTFKSLLEASMLKDNDTGSHIKRVNAYSRFLAEKIREDGKYQTVDRNFVEDIAYLAAMHDVGKIGTPDDILNKEGPLEDWEMGIMKEHTTNGAFILSNYPNPMAKDIALNHHEKWNGSGYPYGKQEEMIPLCARIVAIADVYDALRSKRSYKQGWTHQKSCETIIHSSGSQFDPYLVDLFQIYHKQMDQIWLDLQD